MSEGGQGQSLRLAIALARAGVASRRQAETAVTAGRVRVNGEIVENPAIRVRPGIDDVRLDDAPLPLAAVLRYYAVYKPPGVLSTVRDDRGRPAVTAALPARAGRCVPVGRLDLASEGLLLLTNDGPLINGLLHPRRGLQREYLVEVEGRPTDGTLQRLHDGVQLADGPARARSKRSKRPGAPSRAERPGTSWLVLTLREGRKREVRRMCEAVGHPVVRLIRVRFGPIRLRDMEPGTVRPLSRHEVRLLRRAARHSVPAVTTE